MRIRTTEEIFVDSFVSLSVQKLSELDENFWYSGYTKDEFISQMNLFFNLLKKKGISALVQEKSECKFCYPNSPTYSFLNRNTGEFVARFVIHHKVEDEFEIEECKNVQLEPRDDGLPF